LHVNAYGYGDTVVDLGDALGRSQLLPAVRVLELSVARWDDVLAAGRAIQASPFGAQLARFTITLEGSTPDSSTRDAKLVASLAGGTAGAAELVIAAPNRNFWQYAFRREGERYRRLDVSTTHGCDDAADHDRMLDVVASLPRDLLVELRFAHVHEERMRTRLREAAFAQRRVPEIVFTDDPCGVSR
jgi:hypothetical protein